MMSPNEQETVGAKIKRAVRALSKRSTTVLEGRAGSGIVTQLNRLRGIVFILLGILLASVIAGMLIMRSIPGDAFYGTKTETIEPFMAQLQWSAQEKAEYQIKLLDRRRKELERLIAQGNLPEGAAVALNARMAENFDALKLAVETNERIPQERIVSLLYDATTILYIHDLLVSRNEAFAEIEEAVADRKKEINDIYEGMVQIYVSASDAESIRSYITTELQTLLRRVSDEEPDPETTQKINRRLQQIQTAFEENDAAEAIYLVHESLQLLDVATYFTDSEETQ